MFALELQSHNRSFERRSQLVLKEVHHESRVSDCDFRFDGQSIHSVPAKLITSKKVRRLLILLSSDLLQGKVHRASTTALGPWTGRWAAIWHRQYAFTRSKARTPSHNRSIGSAKGSISAKHKRKTSITWYGAWRLTFCSTSEAQLSF